MQKLNFMKLMGKSSRSWKHIKTKEDKLHLKEFEDLYEKNYRLMPPNSPYLIPQIIHFIWLGPKEFPENSRKNINSWIEKHPNWKFIFWTDIEKKGLDNRIEFRFVDHSLLAGMAELYKRTDNFGEKSDIVRLLALSAYGGLYVDHDMECRIAFDDLHRSYPFYGGLLTPGNPIIKRSAIVRNSIIGSHSNHPILLRALELTKQRWDHIEAEYPGNLMETVKKRVVLRGFKAFHDAVLEQIQHPSFEGIIFPAGCFNQIEKSFGLYAHESMLGSWFTDEIGEHEMYLKNRIHKLMKRMNILFAILLSLIFILFSLNLFLFWKFL
jgi:hypothetical protein